MLDLLQTNDKNQLFNSAIYLAEESIIELTNRMQCMFTIHNVYVPPPR